VLSEDVRTLAEVFHEAGWRTASFVSNTIIGPEFGFAQGTELFRTLPSELTPKTKLGYALFRLTEPGRALPGFTQLRGLLRAVERLVWGRQDAGVLGLPASEVLASFEAWRAGLGSDPYLAYLHVMEPHAPYRPPEEARASFASSEEPFIARHPPMMGIFLPFGRADSLPPAEGRGLVRAYDAEIAGIDATLGPFLLRLAEEPSGRPTLIAVTSDHGEEFYEHGGWGHGQSLHEEQLDVPLLLVGPGVPEDREISRSAQLIDVAPTLIDLAGIPVPDEMAGRSLAPWLRALAGDEPLPPDEGRDVLSEIVYGDAYWARALRQGRWKLVVSRLGESEIVQLYDLERDPGEHDDLAPRLPERVAAMRAVLAERVARAAAGSGVASTAAFDPVTRDRLRALGYVD
jgi:arylsulfatase A-like enzyme